MEIMKRLVREEEGQGMVEYALIIALISIALVASAGTVKTAITNLWIKVGGKIDSAS